MTELTQSERKKLYRVCSLDMLAEIFEYLDEDEIGSRMTVNCIIIREDMTVKQAMNELVRQAEDNDNITTLFVVDENNEFYGAIDLKDLIIARSDTALDDIIASSFPYVYATEQTADCIEKLKDYSESLVPVHDDGNRLLVWNVCGGFFRGRF